MIHIQIPNADEALKALKIPQSWYFNTPRLQNSAKSEEDFLQRFTKGICFQCYISYNIMRLRTSVKIYNLCQRL